MLFLSRMCFLPVRPSIHDSLPRSDNDSSTHPQEVDDPTQVRSSGAANDGVNDSANDSAWESVSYADASGSLDVSLISHGVSPPEVASRGRQSKPYTLNPEPFFLSQESRCA